MTEENSTSGNSGRGITLKLPDFWENDPELWFVNVEAQFLLTNVRRTDTMAYAYVVSELNRPALLAHVMDVVQGPTEGRTYAAIKERLIGRFGERQSVKLSKLMSMELGDKKPSKLLAEMQLLAKSIGVDDRMLRTIFLKASPPNISQVLAIIETTLQQYGAMADEMIAHNPPSSVNQIDASKNLCEQIDTLTAAIRNMKVGPQDAKYRHDAQNHPVRSCVGITRSMVIELVNVVRHVTPKARPR